MTLVTRSIPGLFGGVSQQIPAMRHPTQCAVQDNGLATLVDGLYKRPGTQHVYTFPLQGANGASVAGSNGAAHVHIMDKGDGGLFALVLVNRNLMLYNLLTGGTESVAFANGNTYLDGDPEADFRCITVADYTFIVNRKRIVRMKGTTAPSNPTNVAYVNIKTAVPSVSYSATINGITASYTSTATPTNAAIALGLRGALAAQFPTGTFNVVAGTNVIKATLPTAIDTCTAADGWGNTAIQSLFKGVDLFTDLPPAFEAGYIMAVNGAASTGKDKYYVAWDGNRWVESAAPGVTTELDPATLPYQLRPTGTGSWVFEQIPNWGKRVAGDDDTNPVPSFVDQTINNVFFHRNRLGFLAGDSAILSRAGSYFHFFASSGVQVLDTDPIDLSSSTKDVVSLEWATVYNETLIVWDSNKHQFVLAASDILSPNTARLQPSTTFEVYQGCEPVGIGNTILFPATLGSNTQISQYRVAENRVTNTAEELTDHVPNYVPAMPRMLAASTTLKTLAVVPRGPSKVLHLFKYEVDKQDLMTQKAWQRITFDTADTVRILAAHWRSRKLMLLTHVTTAADVVAGGRFVLQVIDFEVAAQDDQVGFQLCLDRRAKVIAGAFDGTNTAIDIPYLTVDEPVALKCSAGVEPVELKKAGSLVQNNVLLSTRLYVEGNHTGATVWVGRKFDFKYTFTEVFMRDQNSLPIMDANLKLVRVLLRYVTTGWFTATVKSMLRGTYTYPVSGRMVGRPGQGASQLSLTTGQFDIPVHAKAAEAEVTLTSDSYFPCKFPYAEWVGDVTMKARR